MDGNTPTRPKDRAFDPSKVPHGDPAKRLVERFVEAIARLESRVRVRRPADAERHARMCAALVLDLAHREITEPGSWLFVSMQKQQYGTQKRPAWFLTERFPALIQVLRENTSLVEYIPGERGAFGTGRRTAIRAGTCLRTLIQEEGLSLADIWRDPTLRGDVIVLKGHKVAGKARKLAFEDDDFIRLIRSQVEEINAWIAEADLWWAGDEVEDKVDLGDRFVRRIFNDGSFQAGGRLFGGFWQQTKKALRLECIQFGEESAVALDFGQMAVRTAYSLAGAQPPTGDLYSIPGLEQYRQEVKRVLNALLSADGVPQRFPAGSRGRFPQKWKFEDVYAPIARHHSALAPLFGTALSLRFMHIESQVLVDILLRLKAEGVVALPIHDCLLVGESNVAIAQSVMEAACKHHLGIEGKVEITRHDLTG